MKKGVKCFKMTINESEFIEFLKGLYSLEEQIKDNIKSYAESCEGDPKVFTAAWNHFKKVEAGKDKGAKIDELQAVAELEEIINKFLSVE